MLDRPSFQTYYALIDRHTSAYLDGQDPEYLRSVDPDEYLDFLVSEASWVPMEWDETGMTVERFSVKERRRSDFGEYYVADVEKLRLRIPVSPHSQRSEYLKLVPSTVRLNREPNYRFEANTLVLEVEAKEQAVQALLDNVRFWLGNRNKDIELGNASLKEKIRPVWEARRKRLEASSGNTTALLEKLQIPIHADPNSRVRPVEIKARELRTVQPKPRASGTPEPSLDRDDVHALVQFIAQYTRQFETAPGRYIQLGEEGMRDVLVGMLNTNYPGQATAETFSKLGKTDISFRVSDGHVLICECKIWSGPKAYTGALDQLFRYLTWRHNFGVLIHFCTRRDMTRVIAEAKSAIVEQPSTVTGSLNDVTETSFVSRHSHPQDEAKSVETHHLFVDLSLAG
jgi:hypothetical protein